MKKIIYLTLTFYMLIAAKTPAQKRENLTVAIEAKTQKESLAQNQNKSYPVDARPFLEKFYKANGIDLSELSKTYNPTLKKAAAWNFNVGDSHYWYAANFVTNNYDYLPTTCRAVGTHCYIFVVDSLWQKGYVTQAAVDSVEANFDSRTPANSNKGIYDTEKEIFGNPPDYFDNDPKIIIVILDIKDGWTPNSQGGFIAGFFDYTNQYSKSLTNGHSNEAEMYYLDAYPLNLKVESEIKKGMRTTAHEFQHMIHFNYFPTKDVTFFDEGFSEVAAVICGYPFYSSGSYQDESNIFLLNWRGSDDPKVLNDYSRAARFTLYLKEQFGNQIFTKYMLNQIKGISGLNYALNQIGSTRRFNDILVDFFIANYLNNKTVNPKWGYDYPGIPKMKSIVYGNPNVPQTNSSIYKLASMYLTFPQGSNLSVNVNNNNQTAIKAKAIKIGSGTAAVEDITMNSNFSVSGFGTTYNEITVLVYHNDDNASSNGPFSFSYSASGTANNAPIEIAYDNGEPKYAQVDNLIANDSVGVVFSGLPGAKLDSIRVALRQAGSMSGGIWKYTGVLQPSPFAAKLASFIATSNISVRPPVPYPVPYNNWVKVDLQQYNIDVSQDFVVSFVMAGTYASDGSGDNRVMVGEVAGSYPYPSITYLHQPSSGSPRWVYIVGDGTIYPYLIRAYVSYPTSVSNEPIELLPSAYSLEQNYPNPFNPSTTIKFSLPKKEFVKLKVYDLLGREIATLIDGELSQGEHSVNFDAKGLASGVYIYRLVTDKYNSAKKMILLR
ncbi:T9SS type A sorting domain-containing protein [Melioribacteraceae bacterium 4301-Me]|uniref:T9SS type A sorting domain-containing protein n=1 Tax=Pyranulibacter aquaticus TaxID=3163344 RepID=UPI0035964FA5